MEIRLVSAGNSRTVDAVNMLGRLGVVIFSGDGFEGSVLPGIIVNQVGPVLVRQKEVLAGIKSA